jgi:hypothetical protein
MPKRGGISAGRRPAPAPVGIRRDQSGGAASAPRFTALSDAQWQAVRSTLDWPDGTDWRGRIDQTGRHFCEARAEREAWLKTFRAEKPAVVKEKVDRALRSTRDLQKAWADSGLDETDLPDPGLKLRQQRAEEWLNNYDIWVTPYAGKKNPMQNQLEWALISIWVEAGGNLRFSRKKDDATTPYRPLVAFLTVTLEAILGRTYAPSNIASMISKHRSEIANARGMGRRRRGQRFA